MGYLLQQVGACNLVEGIFIFICIIFPYVGSGPLLEVLQDQANPWRSRSKLLHLLLVAKISLISMVPSGDRIRY